MIKINKRDGIGQYLASRYGEEYKVIGNYYLKSKSHNDSTKVDDDALANFLIKDESKNYYRLITEDDRGLLNKEWKYGEGLLNLKMHMNPYQGVDVLFYTHTQTQVVD